MSGASVVAFCFPTKRPWRPDMTNERIPTISREKLLKELSELPEGAEISFSGLRFVQFRQSQQSPPRFQIVFDPQVYRTAAGEVVVDNPE